MLDFRRRLMPPDIFFFRCRRCRRHFFAAVTPLLMLFCFRHFRHVDGYATLFDTPCSPLIFVIAAVTPLRLIFAYAAFSAAIKINATQGCYAIRRVMPHTVACCHDADAISLPPPLFRCFARLISLFDTPYIDFADDYAYAPCRCCCRLMPC